MKECAPMRKKQFIRNVFIMSSSMLVVRIMGMVSNIYISAAAGSSSMGIYHMVFAVFTFGITFAASGTGFAVTRLVAEDVFSEKQVLKKCLAISFVMSFAGFSFFFFAPEKLWQKFIHAGNISLAFKILAFALPCMGTSTVLRGYFIAKRHGVTLTVSSIFEEALCIISTLLLIKSSSMPSYMCLVWGCTVSNFGAFVMDSILCSVWLGKSVSKTRPAPYREIFSICVPIALGSYLRTGLVAIENLMIPMQFQKYGTLNPVGEYGIIKAMAMPILMFPMVFIQAFSSMLVPEMSEMNAKNAKNGIRHVAGLALSTTTMFAFFISLMLFKHHRLITTSFFKENGVGYYLCMLSFLAVPMYMDSVADSILKGLGLQNASLRYNIIDSLLRIASIFFLMPKFGPVFYICMLYISEIFNLSLSLGKASKVTGLKVDFYSLLIKPFLCTLGAYFFDPPLLCLGVYMLLYALKIPPRLAGRVASATNTKRCRKFSI